VGRRQDHQDQIPDAEEPEARWRGRWEYQETRLQVLTAEDGALSVRAVSQLNEEPVHPALLVVPVPQSDLGASAQGVPGVEGPAEDSVGRGAEEDREVEGYVEDP